MRQVSDGLIGFPGLLLRMTARSYLNSSALAVLFALIAFMLTGAILLGRDVEKAATTGAERLGADLMVIPAGSEIPQGNPLIGGLPIQRSLPAGIESSVAAIQGVSQSAPQYFLTSARDSCCDAGDLLLVGFDPARDLTVRPWLKGKYHTDLEEEGLLAGGGVLKWRGAQLRLYNRFFRVAATLDRSGVGYFDNAVFIPLAGLAAMERSSGSRGTAQLKVPWERPSMLLLKLSPGVELKQIAALLEQKFPEVQVVSMPRSIQDKRDKINAFAASLTPLALFSWLLAVMAGGAVQFLFWKERKPALGLLQAWGWGSGQLLVFFGLEALILSLAGMLAGSMIALLILSSFSSVLASVTVLPMLTWHASSLSLSGVLMLWMEFPCVMTVEAIIILFFFIRSEPADLMRGA